jgi:excisionase family DNA binding protein
MSKHKKPYDRTVHRLREIERIIKLLLTIPECCRLAAIGRAKFYELIANGEIPIRKIGRKTLVAASDLRDWVERLPVVETRPAT